MKILRDYQRAAVEASKNFKGYGGLIIAPTGSGKSLILSELCRNNKKIVVLAHRQELIKQNVIEFQELTGEPAGIWSASVGIKRIERVTFVQIQSGYTINFNADLVICDECHLIPAKSTAMYQKFLEKNTGQLIGLTATPYRMDIGHLVNGDSSLFSKVIYDIKYDYLVEQGYLAPLVYKSKAYLRNDSLNIRGNDLDLNKAGEEIEPKLELIINDVLKKRIGKTLWFCPTVGMAHQIAGVIDGMAVTGGIDRTQALADFKNGEIEHLTNVDILTTGFNQPDIETIVFLRPTKSTALFKQMLGRGTRLAPGKSSCLILDYTTNTECHGFLGDDKYPNAKGVSPEYKVCAYCETVIKIGTNPCPECGFKFEALPRGESKILDNLTTKSFDPDAEYVLDLKNLTASVYQKNNKTSIKVDFKVPGGTFSKWLPTQGYYLRKFLGGLDLGNGSNAIEAINNSKLPERVLAKKNGKYFEFLGFV